MPAVVTRHLHPTIAASVVLGAIALLVVVPTPTRAQNVERTAECANIRAPATALLGDAVAERTLPEIVQAIAGLARDPRFATPADPREGRRPRRASYAIRLTDAQLERRARLYLRTMQQTSWWRDVKPQRRAGHTRGLGELGGTIRSLLSLAEAYPAVASPARMLAREMGDAVLAASTVTGIPAAPLPAADRSAAPDPFMRAPLGTLIRNCTALQQSIASGWIVLGRAPEKHYAATARVGLALLQLSRETGEQRFLDWVRDASAWYSRHPLVANVHANAMAAGLDADLFLLTAEDKYLQRAVDRATYGVLPAFSTPQPRPLVQRLPLSQVADLARALVELSTGVAAAPSGTVEPQVTRRIYAAARLAYANLQQRAMAERRLQFPAQQIELALDVERAQRAGASLDDPVPEAFRHVLAHGADRVQRYIPLPAAASGRLLARLKARGWSGAYRVPEQQLKSAESEIQ